MVSKKKFGLPSERATRKLTDDHGLVEIWRRYNPVVSVSKSESFREDPIPHGTSD
jgi:hypothetical protein